jgi:hypothetical protein
MRGPQRRHADGLLTAYQPPERAERPRHHVGAHRRSASRAVHATSPESSLPAAAYGGEEYPCAGAQQREVAEHLDDEHDPGPARI